MLYPLLVWTILNLNPPHAQPPELGKVSWIRDLAEAQLKARNSHKPILILFQEVPGCRTCKNYGSDVLSHPLIVEAIEQYFIPLCIYNNHKGKDADALEKFKEPSWNNPVVRIVDEQLQDIVSRLKGNYTLYGLSSLINSCLIKKGVQIPSYLNLLEEESKSIVSGTKTLYMQMYCFWSGERIYGQLKGIIATNAGFMKGHEVVEITYDPKIVEPKEIIQYGRQHHTAEKVYTDQYQQLTSLISSEPIDNFNLDSENKYYLTHTDYKYIPMTPLQAMRVNSLLSEKQAVEHLFSPRQMQWLSNIKQKNNANRKSNISKDIIKAWYP